MKLLSGMTAISLFASLAVMSPIAVAQTDAHAQTAAALRCLLVDHGKGGCGQDFVGSASVAARPWLYWTSNQEFALGALLSSGYARTETGQSAYITKFLNGRTADIYDVKFAHQEKTFYITPPGPDGKIRYLRVRDGAPDDEARDLFAHGPG